MKHTSLAALTAALAITAAPAFAASDRIGSVDVNYGRDHDVRNFDLGGPIDSLTLRADANVDCRSIRATFGNGRTREIYSGTLYRNRSTNVDLPGRERNITRLAFQCSAQHMRGSQIAIYADVNNDNRQAWMRSPNWGATWAHVFNWGSNAVNDWQYMGQARFVGRHDSDVAYAGRRGVHSDAIALKPVGASARCSDVTATFDNGKTRRLDFDNADYLQQGEFHRADLPGDYRNIDRVSMKCRATDARAVTMEIYTSK